MDNRVEVREFLTSRRARVTPEQAGLAVNGVRRVPGLRRGEVAARAGVSVEYYSRVERGALAGVSTGVLGSIARALRLDPAERAYLFDLARAADGTGAVQRPGRTVERWSARPALQWALDAMVHAPAIVVSARMDLLAANLLGRALYSDAIAGADRSRPVTARSHLAHRHRLVDLRDRRRRRRPRRAGSQRHAHRARSTVQHRTPTPRSRP